MKVSAVCRGRKRYTATGAHILLHGAYQFRPGTSGIVELFQTYTLMLNFALMLLKAENTDGDFEEGI